MRAGNNHAISRNNFGHAGSKQPYEYKPVSRAPRGWVDNQFTSAAHKELQQGKLISGENGL
jgi:hypothetical protein